MCRIIKGETETVIRLIDVKARFPVVTHGSRFSQLTKCYEPLQKLRVRLGKGKIDLMPPVSLYITDRSKAILLWWFLLFYVLVFKFFVLLAPYVCYHIFG